MAYAMIKQGSLDNCIAYEFMCDTLADMNAIENEYRTIGSIAVVLSGESDGLEVYIAGSDKQWNSLSATSGGDETITGGGLTIHICTQQEVSNGKPNISEPDETTVYLVPASQESGNLYDEYIYVDNAWEMFAGARLDLSGYAPIANPAFTGSISLGRLANSTVGTNSVAIGNDVTASGNRSHAEGWGTRATGDQAHTEGSGTEASGDNSHVEGGGSRAIGLQAHAEGGGTTASGVSAHSEGGGTTASGTASHAEGGGTLASGVNAHAEGGASQATGSESHAEGSSSQAKGTGSHAEGGGTIAEGAYSHTGGQLNIADSYASWPEWVSETEYAVGDKVKVTTDAGTANETVVGYICKTANSDVSFTTSKWTVDTRMNYQEIIGNGTSINNRSNIRVLDWNGNERLKGNLYIHCNNDSTGGTTVAPTANPEFTGSISMGRKSGSSSVGGSVAIGLDAEATGSAGTTSIGWETKASGRSSHAEGQGTQAAGWVAHAEGLQTYAYGSASHAEGSHANGAQANTINGVVYAYGATGYASHVEGESTIAAGSNSHAEGRDTVALGANSHVGGQFNVPDNWNGWNEWTANTEYEVGDKVKVTGVSNVTAYSCRTANSDEVFTKANWTVIDEKLNYAEIIGNGTSTSSRSNARALDWSGNEYLKGDLYVGCDADSINGIKLARIPDPPSTNGTYTLQAIVSNGTVTYTWIAGA